MTVTGIDVGRMTMPWNTSALQAIVSDLEDKLTDSTLSEVLFTEEDGMYAFEDRNFKLVLSIDGNTLQIRVIEVRTHFRGLGSDILEALHECADDYSLDVCALNVHDRGAGFWLKMGYEESEEQGVYHRNPQ